MTYQSELARDRHAGLALALHVKYPKVDVHALAYYLAECEVAKPLHDDHLKQMGVKWIRGRE